MTVHVPVLLNEVLAHLNPKDGEVYVDCTFGAGGYTRAILQAANCRVIALDRDADAIARGAALQQEFGSRLTLIKDNFNNIKQLFDTNSLDGIVADLGVSSPQLDVAERGFSFLRDGPLDMRMDRSTGPSAADVVNTETPENLVRILQVYGEENYAKKIVRAIISHRPFTNTLQLAECIKAAVPPKYKFGPIHPATRSFQALRIYVNGELDAIETLLVDSPELIKKNGRLVIVSFHSGEDSLVKSILHRFANPPANPSRHSPDMNPMTFTPLFTLNPKKPVAPTDAEIAMNPRARSARLRAAIRTGADA